MELVWHPPYSPNMAPSDFHVFPFLKKYLGGMKFEMDEEMQEIRAYLRDKELAGMTIKYKNSL